MREGKVDPANGGFVLDLVQLDAVCLGILTAGNSLHLADLLGIKFVCAAGSQFDHAELLDFCSARMPYFCVPRYLEVLDELPKNVIGRVRKDLLLKSGLGENVWDREDHGYILSR